MTFPSKQPSPKTVSDFHPRRKRLLTSHLNQAECNFPRISFVKNLSLYPVSDAFFMNQFSVSPNPGTTLNAFRRTRERHPRRQLPILHNTVSGGVEIRRLWLCRRHVSSRPVVVATYSTSASVISGKIGSERHCSAIRSAMGSSKYLQVSRKYACW